MRHKGVVCLPVIVEAYAELVECGVAFQHAPHVNHTQLAKAEHLRTIREPSVPLAHSACISSAASLAAQQQDCIFLGKGSDLCYEAAEGRRLAEVIERSGAKGKLGRAGAWILKHHGGQRLHKARLACCPPEVLLQASDNTQRAGHLQLCQIALRRRSTIQHKVKESKPLAPIRIVSK